MLKPSLVEAGAAGAGAGAGALGEAGDGDGDGETGAAGADGESGVPVSAVACWPTPGLLGFVTETGPGEPSRLASVRVELPSVFGTARVCFCWIVAMS